MDLPWHVSAAFNLPWHVSAAFTCLVLRSGSHPTIPGEMGEERAHLRLRHFPRVSFPMVKNKPADPIDVTAFGPNAVMFLPDRVPHLIEQFRVARGVDAA